MEKLGEDYIPRPEYPRPQFARADNWINLNGEWDFVFDDANKGLKERWYKRENSKNFDRKIIVPYCFQSRLSGIEDNSFFFDLDRIYILKSKILIPLRFELLN